MRLDDARFAPSTVICNEDHRYLVAEEFRALGKKPHAIVLEPVARNTAPAIAAAAFLLSRISPETLMAVLPSDHVIKDIPAFHTAIDRAAEAARSGYLATFGITPQRPETGYGYIQGGPLIDQLDATPSIRRFVEKPDLQTAESYIEDGSYYWNSGMFLFRACDFLDELKILAPKVWEHSQKAVSSLTEELGFFALNQESFSACPSISVDYAVMEKTTHGVVIPSDFGWSDVGSWRSLRDISATDENGNVVLGDVSLHGAKNSYVRTDAQLVTAIGIEDMVVVATDDAVLIAPATQDQDVRLAVDTLKAQNRPEATAHSQVFRPWGSYQNMYVSEGVLVKQIIVYPGSKLSLQYHDHRAEHWVVVEGTARVTNGDRVFDLVKDQSTYIPLGALHRLENIGTSPLKIVEVQLGDLISEEDIVRIEDDFGRA